MRDPVRRAGTMQEHATLVRAPLLETGDLHDTVRHDEAPMGERPGFGDRPRGLAPGRSANGPRQRPRMRALAPALVLGFWLAAPAEAWEGDAEAGITATSGNSETESLLLKVSAKDERRKWRHKARADALRNKDQDTVSAERYVAEWESNYKLDERNYVFGAARWSHDRFSAIERQYSIAGGYGRRFIDSERQTFDASIGAGYKRFREQGAKDEEDDAILRLSGDYRLETTESSDFRQRLLIEAGDLNTYIESISDFTAKINRKLATRLSYTVQHNTDVSPGTENTDTISSVTLVYSF